MIHVVRGVRTSILTKIGMAAIIAAAVVCFWATGFAHENGAGQVGNHGPHDPLPSYLTYPGGIMGTAHDFATGDNPRYNVAPLGEVQGCIVCHDGPTWNHDDTATATFTLSTTTSTEADIQQPSGVTLDCLGCHDGTVPVDAFGGSAGTAGLEIQPDEDGYLGTNLRRHHPVGITYSDASPVPLAPVDGPNRYGESPSDFLMEGGTSVECTTCHDQHTHFQKNNPLNVPGRYSGVHTWGSFVKVDSLCFQCHERYQEDVDQSLPSEFRRVSPYGPSSASIPAGVPVSTGHHFPGRDDPLGDARGVGDAGIADLSGDFQFACNSCHNIDDANTYDHDPDHHTHNSPCIECHKRYDPAVHASPAAPAAKGHHGGDRNDPLNKCLVCHADSDPASPSFGMLIGAPFGLITAPSCGSCHSDVWSVPTPDAATVSVAPTFKGKVGEEVKFTATVSLNHLPARGEEVTFEWFFGDGTPAQFPVTISFDSNTKTWSGEVSATHAFGAPGTYTGNIAVTDGNDTPDVASFEVTISEPGGPGPGAADAWNVTEGGAAAPTFQITFQPAVEGVDGVFTAVKQKGAVASTAFGIEIGGVIFWMDMKFNYDGWGVGNTYFGNINRGAGEMVGILITPTGATAVFEGEKQ